MAERLAQVVTGLAVAVMVALIPLVAAITPVHPAAPRQLPSGAVPEVDVAAPYVAHQLVLKFRPGVSAEEQRRIEQALGLNVRERANPLGLVAVELPPGVDESYVRARLEQTGAVAHSERNLIFRVKGSYAPNDPLLTGPYQTTYDGAIGQWALAKVNAEQAWGSFRGPGSTVVAVVDTGVDATHPDLAGRVLSGINVLDGSANATDDHGHGTLVSGVIAATADNATGIAGISFNTAEILPVKVLDRYGNGTEVDVAAGITWAADNGAQVINLSLGGSLYSQALQDAVNYAWSKGVTVIAAAGNGAGDSPEYPASNAHVLGVAATDQNDQTTHFDTYGAEVGLSAPGIAILSTMPTYPVQLNQSMGFQEGYDSFSGTSAAAPLVSGLAALLLAQQPGQISNSGVVTELERSADSLSGGGWDPHSGFGRLDAANLIAGTFRADTTGSIRGQVTDAAGNPVASAVVSAVGVSATTVGDGMYRLANLPLPGPVTLSIASGGATYQSVPVSLVAGADAYLDVPLTQLAPPPAPVTNQPVGNGGFEAGSFAPWAAGGGAPTPILTRRLAHSGTYSALLGGGAGSEPSGDSWIAQIIHLQLPAGATHATLSFADWTASTDLGSFDYQEAQVRDRQGNVLATIFKGAFNVLAWQVQTFDLTPWNGQDVQLFFAVHEDGKGDPTWMYVDDVGVTYS